ncbi:MAG: hypothetical protein J5819_08345 [Eubacterium sp.]|nr:hypothetical protein [Eubacterium sp.]
MNKTIGMVGSAVNALTVLGFAICLLIHFPFGYYFVCILLALSFLCMIGAFDSECTEKNKTAGRVALVMAGVYATLILIVYYTQCTTVQNESLTPEISRVLDYKYLGLVFNLDILGYGIMALSTFFIGLTIQVKNKVDKALKILLLGHGLFFPGCLIMPMTGMFLGHEGSSSSGGVIALEIWCLYFLPIGILSVLHFRSSAQE